MLRRSLSFFRKSLACAAGSVILFSSLLHAAEFKPFVAIQTAGPVALADVAQAFGVTVHSIDPAILEPLKNMRGIAPNGKIGLALQINEDAVFGLDAVIVLPITNVANFNIPGLEMPLMAAKMQMGAPVNGKYTIRDMPLGEIVAFQKRDYLIFATEGAAGFAETGNPDTLFAEINTALEDSVFGLTIKTENISQDDLQMVFERSALLGLDVDPDEMMEYLDMLGAQLGPSVMQIISDTSSLTMGLGLDPKTLDVSLASLTVAKTNTPLAGKFQRVKNAETKLGAFLLETPQTVFAVSLLDYLTDAEIDGVTDLLDIFAESFLQGFIEALEENEGDGAQIVQALELFLEYIRDSMSIVAEERLLDASYTLNADGTLIVATATSNAARYMELDKQFYRSLLEILDDEDFTASVLGRVKHETVSGYAFYGLPNVFSELPAGISLPDEARNVLTNLPLSVYWAVKEGEILVYALGLDADKTERALKEVLARPMSGAPMYTGVFAMKPFGELLLQQVLPLLESFPAELDASFIAGTVTAFAILGAMDADAKMTATIERPSDNAVRELYRIDGRVTRTLLEVIFRPAIVAAQHAANRMQCSNHMKVIGLALHNYHDAYQAMPPLYTVDADGKPLHSWRVLILPFIEQNALFQQIRLTEPWDSPHNSQFHQVRIPLYACPDNPNVAGRLNCTYSAISGDVAGRNAVAFVPATEPGKLVGNSFVAIRDGTSNTLAVVEVRQPFNWMDPTADIDLDTFAKGINKPDGRAGSFHTGGANAVFFDGAVRFIDDTIDSSILRALGTCSGGEAASLP
ncbi:MAG: DUF1559 domain-containing protein [Planctomycetaceae bacterium]|nr:DUF1559 domain-containing protein [Planctomycetaceae bacterium]